MLYIVIIYNYLDDKMEYIRELKCLADYWEVCEVLVKVVVFLLCLKIIQVNYL